MGREGADVAQFVVAITGGARGIGRATARAFAAAGARVVIGDIDQAAAELAAVEFGGLAVQLDVRDRESFAAFVATAGAIDVMVNNAGVAHAASFLDTPADMRDLQIDVNLRGVVNGMAAALPGMIERDRGHLVNVASLAGRIATPNAAIYTATKFAVVGLTEAVRAELHGTRVRATAVLPTFVRTQMTAGLPLTGVPKVSADDVARAILRVVRRGGPATVAVPRWLGGLPRLAAFTPQALQDLLRQAATESAPRQGAHPGMDHGANERATYVERVRGLLPPDAISSGPVDSP